jgi:transposase
MTGVKTNIVVALEIGERNSGDSPYFKPLLESTTEDFRVRRVLGDKAYSSYANLDFAAEKGAAPVIPFRARTTSKNSGCETWDKLHHFYSFHRQEFMKAYHKRSNVESTLQCHQARVRGFRTLQEQDSAGQRSAVEGDLPQHPSTHLRDVRAGD